MAASIASATLSPVAPPGTPAATPPALSAAALWRECRLQVRLSLPISLSYLLGFGVQLTSQVIVGHISASALAAASLATIYANATGMACVIGLTSACETLASQAYGAGNLPRVGAVAQRASAVMLAVCVPVAALWLLAGPALRALGQDAGTVALAEAYIRLQLPGLPAVAVYEVLKRTLQSVDVAGPQVAIGCVALAANAALGAALVYGTPLGFLGAPLALSASQVLTLALMLLYIRDHRRVNSALRGARAAWQHAVGGSGGGGGGERDVASLAAAAAAADQDVDLRQLDSGVGGIGPSLPPAAAVIVAAAEPPLAAAAESPPTLPMPKPTPPTPTDVDDIIDAVFSLPLGAQHAFSGWREYLLLGIPSALLLVVEWGSFEVGAIIAGLISTDALAAHTVIASTAAVSFMPPLGLSVAVGIRIGQCCGEVDVERAKLAYLAALSLDTAFIGLNAAFVLGAGAAWAAVFTDDAGVLELVASAIWMLALYSLFDSLQCIASGGMRGLGLPGLCAAANVTGWVGVGLTGAYFFAITEGVGLRGIWVGFTAAVFVTFALMTAVLMTKDWHAIAVAARARAQQDILALRAHAGDDAAEAPAPLVTLK